jgi:hypothetical protein
MLREQRILAWESVAIVNMLFSLDILPYKFAANALSSPVDGSDSEDWKDFCEIASSIFSRWCDRWSMRLGLASGSDRASVLLRRQNLKGNLTFSERLGCRDPRDRIFALLGIYGDNDQLGIDPDYSEHNTLSQHFRSTSVRIFSNTTDLWPLVLACRYDHSDPGVPS